jgi:hypothetical protein
MPSSKGSFPRKRPLSTLCARSSPDNEERRSAALLFAAVTIGAASRPRADRFLSSRKRCKLFRGVQPLAHQIDRGCDGSRVQQLARLLVVQSRAKNGRWVGSGVFDEFEQGIEQDVRRSRLGRQERALGNLEQLREFSVMSCEPLWGEFFRTFAPSWRQGLWGATA